MKGKELTEEYLNILNKGIDYYYEDYRKAMDKVNKSNAKYKGKPVPFLYQPMFFTDEDIENFNRIAKLVMSIGNKVTDRYIEDEDFRKKFKYPKLLEELILKDPGYATNIPVGRFDLFYEGGDVFKFIEINTDGTSGMNEENTFSKIILESEAMKPMREKYDISYFELMDRWVEDSLEVYSRFDRKVDRPNIAIVDFKETGITAEFEEFQKAYEKKGYNCYIIDPRDFVFRDGGLYYEDVQIHMIYRRIVTVEFIEKSDEIPDLIEAYKAGAVCLIGSLRSQIMHNKIIFKVLYDEDTWECLSQDEIDFIKAHIPYTEELKGDRAILKKLKNKKDSYIIKPIDSFASQGVYAGRDYSQKDWEDILDDCWEEEYLYQEFIDPYKRKFVEFKEDGKAVVDEFNMNVGVYMYDEAFAGVYTRISKENIIFGREGYYSIPNLWIREKNS